MKHAVLGFLLAGTAVVSAQGSVLLTRPDLETPLLVIWGLALLMVGQRVKSIGRQSAAGTERAATLTAAPVQAGVQAA